MSTTVAGRSDPRRRDLAVLLGGAIGTVARAGIAELIPVTPGAWPWATLTANLVGTALLAVLLVTVTRRGREVSDVRLAFLGTGVLGSFTTFSAFAVEVRTLGLGDVGLTYGVVSVVAGLALVRAVVTLAPEPEAGA